MKKLFLFISVFILFCRIIFADSSYNDLFGDTTSDEVKKEEKNTAIDKKNFDFRVAMVGDHAFEIRIPVIKDNMNFDGYIKSPKIMNDFGVEVYYKSLKLITHWQFDVILNAWGDINKFLELLPLENYISWSPSKFRFALGFQKFNWGTGDKINPTDNVNLLDIRKPYDPRKLPVFSLSADFYPTKFFSIETLYIPFYLSLPTGMYERVENIFTDPIIYEHSTLDPQYFGLAAKFNFFFRYIDFSFSYLTQIDPYQSVQLQFEKVSKSGSYIYEVDRVDLINRRLHNIGVDFRAVAGPVGLWGEACFTITEDFFLNRRDIRNHQFKWVLGIDKNYGPNGNFYFNFQYFGVFTPLFYTDFYNDYNDGEIDTDKSKDYYTSYYYRIITNSSAMITEGLLQGIAFNFQWPFLNNKLTPSLELTYSLPLIYDTNREARYGNLFVNPELDIMPLDSFHILVGADLYFSWHKWEDKVDINTGNLTGENYKNSNIYLIVKYKWGIDFKK